MADSSKKISNLTMFNKISDDDDTGFNNSMVTYIKDVDKDMKNLFNDKTLNLNEAKRYAYTIG